LGWQSSWRFRRSLFGCLSCTLRDEGQQKADMPARDSIASAAPGTNQKTEGGSYDGETR
jgi:hypothetical protein